MPVTFIVGQLVVWPPAPGGLAQVEELRRVNVRLFYRTARGLPRFATVRAARLAELQGALLFDGGALLNHFERGLGPARSKTFAMQGEEVNRESDAHSSGRDGAARRRQARG